jgi:hypothetical protein
MDTACLAHQLTEHERREFSDTRFKIAYFLSDTSVAGRGNFWGVPVSRPVRSLYWPKKLREYSPDEAQ